MDADTDNPILTARFDAALAYASALHRQQLRKAGVIPYVSHLLGVCAIALENGAVEDQAIAALLHDSVEDQGGLERLADIRERFGDRVAEMVWHSSDSDITPKPPWRELKQSYIASLGSKPRPSLEVSIADKTHNLGTIIDDLHGVGEAVFERFNGGREGTLWYYRTLAVHFSELAPGRGAERFARLVIELERLTG